MEALATWVRSRSGYVDPTLCIQDHQPSDLAKRYRGVFAGPDGLPANHTFLRMPYSGLVSADTSRINLRFDEWNCRYGLTSWDSLM
ncbi:hypothetical protein BVRB_021090 [Beta vulgaris subsp. vulgaris]|uniref:Uncharacterized protein n=1 Tax=Beta vulgaris subsp. vulgaris TaxID=3555 RepID=A0A0J8DUI0_BETVV|nr:hypothetical protein BVRB_021090 [Beta vulgaris subsp. vulgaris]